MGNGMIYALAGALVITFLGNIVSGYFDSESILIIAVAVAITGSIIAFIYTQFKKTEKSDGKENNSIYDHFSRVNELLKQFPSGEGIIWQGAKWANTQTTTIYTGEKYETFRSFLSYLEKSKEEILIIYNITRDGIADIYSSISRDLYEDHFSILKSHYKSFGRRGTGEEDYMGYGRGKKGRKPRFSIPLEQEGGEDGYEPPDEMVDKISEMSKPKEQQQKLRDD